MKSCFLPTQKTDQYNRNVSRGVDASDVLVERLDGSIAVVVCDGEDQHVAVRPVDRPASPVITQLSQDIIKPLIFRQSWLKPDLLICSWQYRPSASSWKTKRNSEREFRPATKEQGNPMKLFLLISEHFFFQPT